jgi:methionyl-tRNA formyltransferase
VAVPPQRGLVAAGFDVPLVVSGADRRRGRGSATSPSPVKAAALELGLPVTDRVDDVLDVSADLGVVVAYGRLVRPHVLAEVPMVNLHFSLLPRWRGAAPVERALLAGDDETGVCLMQLEEGLDTGPVYGCERVAIGPEETLDELRSRLVDVGTDLLLRSLREGLGAPAPQEGEVTYAAKLDPAELRLDWSRPAAELHRVVRLGRAWTTFRGARMRVLRARVVDGGDLPSAVMPAGEGALELVEVQPEGKRPMAASAWLAGARPQPGERLA